MKSKFWKDVSTGKGDFWNFTSYFVFFPNIPEWFFWWYDLPDQ